MFSMLAETAATAFDASQALELGQTCITWIMNVIKSEPILAGAFVIGILVPAGFAIVGRVKGLSR